METALQLKNNICARSNARKQATVDGLWQVLLDMQRKGVTTFTIAQVGRHAEAAGVLKTQTLRNTGGEDYRALIEAFAVVASGNAVATVTSGTSPLEAAIDGIQDLDIRTRLKMVLAENRRQRDEINRLRQAFKVLQLPSIMASQVGSNVEMLSSPAAKIDLTPLERLLSEVWIDERRWSVEANGAIYDENGEKIAPIGFVQALKAAIQAVSS